MPTSRDSHQLRPNTLPSFNESGKLNWAISLTVSRLFCLSARASLPYTQVAYQPGDCLVFGSESHGLPEEFLSRHAGQSLTIPMPGGKVRSLNLATATAIVLYEALRQLGVR